MVGLVAVVAVGAGRAAGQDVVVLDYGSLHGRAVQAAASLGLSATLVADPELLADALAPVAPALLVVDVPCCTLTTAQQVVIADFALAGHATLLSYWDLDQAPILQDAFGVAATTDLFTPLAVYPWVPVHPIFTTPFPIGGSVAPGPGDDWTDNGDRLQPESGGAAALAGFSAGISAGEGAIVESNGGTSLVNGFLADDLEEAGAVALLADEMAYLLGGIDCLPVQELTCVREPGIGAVLSWSLAAPVDSLEVARGGAVIAVLPGDALGYVDTESAALAGYEVTATCPGGGTASVAAACAGPEPWLEMGPYAWGLRSTSDTVLLTGGVAPFLLETHYPAAEPGEDTPVAAGGPFPVIFFEHAGGAAYDQYDYLFSRLASRGAIVVSIDHVGIESLSPFWESHVELFLEAIDRLELWDADPGDPFFGVVDWQRMSLAGHSHGAGSALEVARLFRPMEPAADLEVRSLVLLAPCPHTGFAMDDYLAEYPGAPPTQVIYGSKDSDGCVAGGQAIAIAEVGGRPRHFVYVVGANHHGFDEGSLAGATISREDHHRAAAASIVAFESLLLHDDLTALPALRGDVPLLYGSPEIRTQFLDEERAVVDDHENPSAATVPGAGIVGIPGQTFVNGFLGDTFADFDGGVALVRAEVEALLAPLPSGCHEVIFYRDDSLGPDVYEVALDQVVASGLICTPTFTSSDQEFADLLAATAPGDALVVALQQNGSPTATHPFDDELAAHICAGGKAIISDFRIASPTAAATLACSASAFDGTTNFTTLTSASTLFTGTLVLTNPGWGIATYGLETDAIVFATNELLTPVGDPGTSSLDLPVTATGFSTFAETFALDPARTLYHPTWALELAWTATGAVLSTELSASGGFDAQTWDVLSLRLARLEGDPLNPPGATLDLDIALVDTSGREAVLPLSAAPQGALRPAVAPSASAGWKSVFETYRLPLSGFLAAEPLLDLAALQRIEFRCDVTEAGRLVVDDIELTPGCDGSGGDCNGNGLADGCDIALGLSADADGDGLPDECGVPFVRGDTNGDGAIDLADAIHTLSHLFAGVATACRLTHDVNDDGAVDVADAVSSLDYQFAGGPPPPPPFPDCGPDPSPDAVGCETSPCSAGAP